MDKVLILGAKGMLGGQLMKVFGNQPLGWDRNEVDITNFSELKNKLKALTQKPRVVINCVAYNDVDGAENNKQFAYKLNAEVVGNLADITQKLNIPLVHFSTNYVFDGEKGEYTENDKPHPLSVYAESKYLGEQALLQKTAKFYLVRTAVIFGPKAESTAGKRSFVELMLDLSTKNIPIKVVADEVNSITFAADLAGVVKSMLDNHLPYGIYHLTNAGEASWYDFAKEIFSIAGKKINLIPISSDELPRKAKRPKKAVLTNTKLPELRPWQEALKDFLKNKV